MFKFSMTKKGTKTITVSPKMWKIITNEKIRLDFKTVEEVLKNWYKIYKEMR